MSNFFNRICYCILLMCTSLPLFSQEEGPSEEEMAVFYERLDNFMENYRYLPGHHQVDSSLLNVYNFPPDSVPEYPDEVIAERLRELGSPIPMDFNSYVRAYIDMYVTERRGQVRRMLGLKHVFFPIFEEVLDREGMPLELAHLAVVESALNPHAVSRVGATGLWQFMYYTGKQYGLKVTSHVDERRDPFKATEAAFRYLNNMYKTYGDWLTVIAAYNCGPGNVNKAIRKAGGSKNYWEIREYLPRETRGYVPAFIAATYVFNYAAEHNLYPKAVDFSYHQDTILIHKSKVTLQQIAALTETSFYELKDLNPELKTSTVPYSSKPYMLRVPHKVAVFFTMNRDSAWKFIAETNADSILKTYRTELVSAITRKPYMGPENSLSAESQEQNLVFHYVRSGEVVGKIAERYHVSARDIARWNNLYRYRIRAGQKLKIYTRNEPSKQIASAEKPKTIPKTTSAGDKLYHTVQSGDTLWDIARLYQGTTIEEIKSLNSLAGNELKPGQVLRVK